MSSRTFKCDRIWDLINKIQIKRIEIPSEIRDINEMICWNNTYSIIRCNEDSWSNNNYIALINLEKGEIEKIFKESFLGIKKISIDQLGECLISCSKNKVQLYSM